MCAYPHHIAYFNETIGGLRRGSNHLLGSSLSWGQDWLYLEQWHSARSSNINLRVISSGAYNPSCLGLECFKYAAIYHAGNITYGECYDPISTYQATIVESTMLSDDAIIRNEKRNLSLRRLISDSTPIGLSLSCTMSPPKIPKPILNEVPRADMNHRDSIDELAPNYLQILEQLYHE